MTSQTPITLPTDQIQPNPFQPRSNVKPEEIDELISSIKSFGILEPIVVAKTPVGYQIIAGERRWRAAKQIGLTEVPVRIKLATPRSMLEMAIVENVQRVDLSPIERAQAFRQLMREFGLRYDDLCERIGKSKSYISNSIKLLALPDAVKDGLISGQISEGHARALLGIQDPKDVVELYKTVLKENASVRRTEELARRLKELRNKARTPGKKVVLFNSEENDKIAQKLQSIFAVKSRVKLVRTRIQTKVTFTLFGTPEETQEELGKILTLTKKRAVSPLTTVNSRKRSASREPGQDGLD